MHATFHQAKLAFVVRVSVFRKSSAHVGGAEGRAGRGVSLLSITLPKERKRETDRERERDRERESERERWATNTM